MKAFCKLDFAFISIFGFRSLTSLLYSLLQQYRPIALSFSLVFTGPEIYLVSDLRERKKTWRINIVLRLIHNQCLDDVLPSQSITHTIKHHPHTHTRTHTRTQQKLRNMQDTNRFARFFSEKVSNLVSSFTDSVPVPAVTYCAPSSDHELSQFCLVSDSEVRKLIKSLPSKHCRFCHVCHSVLLS